MKLNVPDDYLTDLYELIWKHLKENGYAMPTDDRKVWFAIMGDLYGERLGQMTPEDFREELDKLLNGDKS